MRIGELAECVGIAPGTIRYYEGVGLLSPPGRRKNRYRDYGPEAIEDLQFIQKAQLLGLKLKHIRQVMEISAGGQSPCDHVRSVVEEHLNDVEHKLRELRALRSTLEATLAKLDAEPVPAAGCRCAVIESALTRPKRVSAGVDATDSTARESPRA